MPYDDRSAILERYRNAVRDYAEAVESLGTAPCAEFPQLWERAERARTQVTLSRVAFLRHERGQTYLLGAFAESTGEGVEDLVFGD